MGPELSGALQVVLQLWMMWRAWQTSRLFSGYYRWTIIWVAFGLGLFGMLISPGLVILIAFSEPPAWVITAHRYVSPLWVRVFFLLGFELLYRGFSRVYAHPPRHELPNPSGINMDEQSIVTAWDANARTMFGYTATEAIGQPLTALIVPERYQQAHRDGVARYVRERYQRQLRMQYPMVAWDRDHIEFDVMIRISVVLQADGSIQFAGTINKVQ